MREPLFELNAVVRHASGGSDMLVKGRGTDAGQLWCVWFNGRYYHAGSFDEKDLIRSNGVPKWKADFAETGFYPNCLSVASHAQGTMRESVV